MIEASLKEMLSITEHDAPRFSIALAIEGVEDTLLYGLRSSGFVDDYKGYWSIPSVSMSRSAYNDAVYKGVFSKDLLEKLHEYIGAEVIIGDLLIKGERSRAKYYLYQAVFRATLKNACKKSTFKYDSLDYFTLNHIIKKSSGKVGTCISLYLQYLIDKELLPSTYQYCEVSPEIASQELKPELISSPELWRLAGPNYKLLLQGKTGTDGGWIRSLSLDRFMNSLIDDAAKSNSTILDVGCGDGELVERALLGGADAWGIDIGESNREIAKSRILCGDVLDSDCVIYGKLFNLVIANLLLEWVEDLEGLLQSLSQCLSKEGRIVASFTVPEFSHGGEWLYENESFYWLQKKGLRRDPELVMLNRCVGPVRYYPRSTADIINKAVNAGLVVCGMQDIYLDTLLDSQEFNKVIKEWPQLLRHKMLPFFRIIEFSLRSGSSQS